MKNFIVILALMLVLPGLAQQTFQVPSEMKMPYKGPVKKQMQSASAFKAASGTVSQRFDPGWSVLRYRGQVNKMDVDTNNIGLFPAPVYMDSTVRMAFLNATVPMLLCKLGMTFDPQSTVFDPTHVNPLFNKNDLYYLDTVWIGGIYNRRRPSIVDTLIVEIVWGEMSNTSVYSYFNYPSSSPLSAWGSFATPRFNNSKQHGDACYLATPLTNRKVIRSPITSAGNGEYFPIVVNGPAGLLLKGSDLVSVMYTYKPGSILPMGAVVWDFGGSHASIVTENGFAAFCYAQKNPEVTDDESSYANYFDDPTGKNYGLEIFSRQRYGLVSGGDPFNTRATPTFEHSYWIDFSIHGISTVGIKNYNNDVLLLGQNIPNPAIDETTIHYSLKSNAKEVKLTLTDLMGRELYTETIGSKPSGAYSVNLNTAGLPAGVYYYSLQVDGATATKKMMISK